MQRARPPRRPWNRPRVHRSQVASRSCTPHASGRGGYGGAGPGRPHASRRRRRRTSRWPRLHGTASLRGQRRDEPDRPGIRPRVSLPTPSRRSRPGPGARRPGPSGDPRGRARIGRGRRRRAPTRGARWQATPGGTCDDVWVRCGRCTRWTGGLRHWRLPCRSRGGARPCPGGGMGVDQGSARTASDRRRPPLWSSRRGGCASACRQSGQRRRRVSGLDGVTPSAPAVPVSGGTTCAACTRDVTVMAVKACWISSAYAGMAARFSMASGAARVRTNGSGSTSPPMPGGNASRWSQKHSAENCQRKKLRRETIPVKYNFTDAEIAALVAFLQWIGDMDLNGFPAKPTLLPVAVPAPATGEVVASPERPKNFTQMCIACHSLDGQGGVVGPALDGVGDRRSYDNLVAWITDPPQLKPGTLMPKLPLTQTDIVELASFLSNMKQREPSTP